MTEEWRRIRGCQPGCEVSDKGRVRNAGSLVPQRPGRAIGRNYVVLVKNSVRSVVRVDRLVAVTFLGWMPSDVDVIHSDKDVSNDRLENLSWAAYPSNRVKLYERESDTMPDRSNAPTEVQVVHGGSNKYARLTATPERLELKLGREIDEPFAIAVAERVAAALPTHGSFRGDLMRHGEMISARMRATNRSVYEKFIFDRAEVIPT